MSKHQDNLDKMDRLAAFMQEVIDDIKIRGMSPEDAGEKLKGYFAPSGEGEPHTLKNLRAKRVALGFDPVYDMVYPLYCDECTAAANTLELHLETGCTGTFRAPVVADSEQGGE